MNADLEKLREHLAGNYPAHVAVMGAYAPTDHLSLFWVGNKNQDRLYVLASSRFNAKIIAMMGGHIRNLQNAQFWKHNFSPENNLALKRAIQAGVPGVIAFRENCVITREKVFNSETTLFKVKK